MNVPHRPAAGYREVSLYTAARSMTATDQKPRIAFFGYAHDARGGIAQFGRRLAEAVGERGDVRLVGYRRLYPRFTRPGRQAPDPSRRSSPLAGAAIAVPWLPWTWHATAKHLDAFRPDLLVVQWWSPLFGPSTHWLLRHVRRNGARTVVMVHNDRPHEWFPFWRNITRSTLAQADVLATFTSSVADSLKTLLPAADIHVSPLPPLLDLADGDGHDGWAGRLGPPAGPEILFFGNVRAYKGLEDLVAALPIVRRSVEATLVVAGSFFEPIERYRQQARRLGVDDAIRFVPDYVADEDVAGLFARTDVVALPYRSAPGSGVLGQAAAAGKPVVATSVGSLPALVGDRGILVPPGDAAALAAGLVRALRQPPPPPRVEQGSWDDWRDFVLANVRDR
jgi:glycosyltransferase involved in cell wall biosynthesis